MPVVHRTTIHHMAQAVSWRGLRADVAKVEGFNAKLAVFITRAVGTMAMAYAFSLLALASLPAILSNFAVFHGAFPNWMVSTSLIALIAWIAQTYIQLVLLAVIMVGQSVQSAAADARAAQTFADVEKIIDALDTRTEGGLQEVLAAIKARP